jgi:3'-phosphoadenosine 5'-phosphosulfate (PAPS) 3'-phosphatase
MSSPPPPKTVLVIENDRPIFLGIKGHLKGAGVVLVLAAGGQATLLDGQEIQFNRPGQASTRSCSKR